MKVKKAGTILINPNDKTVALVYRENLHDYSFPKGHLEDNETLIECAIRETEEETKRIPIILDNDPIDIIKYITPKGEEVECYFYLARDGGKSNNTSTDTHPTYFIPYDDVNSTLTHDNLKELWNNIKDRIFSLRD